MTTTNVLIDWRAAGFAPVTLIGDVIHVLAQIVDGKLKLLKGRRLPPETDPITTATRVLGDAVKDPTTDLSFDITQSKMRIYYPVVEPTDATTSETVQWVPLYYTKTAAALGVEPTFPFIMACAQLKRLLA